MLHDYKLGLRMLLKFPGLTIAGGLALAIAIGIGAGWAQLASQLISPKLPLPDGDRIVQVQMHDALANAPEPRIARDFLEWRGELTTIEELGALRTQRHNLIVDNSPPLIVQTAELTAAAFQVARVAPLLGRGLIEEDDALGQQNVVVLGYDVWQRAFEARGDVIGSQVILGGTQATVVGVMPQGFGFPVNQRAWMPLQLRAQYEPLEGGALGVVGRLALGATLAQANAELRAVGERTAAALPATHEHLQPRAVLPGRSNDLGAFDVVVKYAPGLLALVLACTTVGTLIYARTALREGELAIRSALGASRARIVGQLFVEALVLASVAAAVGLFAADRLLGLGIEGVFADEGGAPYWMTPGLTPATVLYAAVLAVVSAALLSLLPALRVTRARVQPYLASAGSGGATLRFGRVWTAAMLAQVALTAMAIPASLESVAEVVRNVSVRAAFPSDAYLAATVELERASADESDAAFAQRRAGVFAALEQRLAAEPGVVAVTFADHAPGAQSSQFAGELEISSGTGAAFEYLPIKRAVGIGFASATVGPGFFEAFDRPAVAGRAFSSADFGAEARAVLINEAFVRQFIERGGSGSPLGERLRHVDELGAAVPAAELEIVGVVRDFGLSPDDEGLEAPFVYFPAPAATIAAPTVNVRMAGGALVAPLAAQLSTIAASVDPGLHVPKAQPLGDWIRQRDRNVAVPIAALSGVTLLVLFLAAMGIFALTSISVSRRTREIGLRTALGASPRSVLGGILRRAAMLTGVGSGAGGGVVLLVVALGGGPTGRPADDVATFAVWLSVTAAIMLFACLAACIEPARRALRIHPIDALRDA